MAKIGEGLENRAYIGEGLEDSGLYRRRHR